MRSVAFLALQDEKKFMTPTPYAKKTYFSFQLSKRTLSCLDSVTNKDTPHMDEYEWKKTAITVVLVLAILAGMVYGMIQAI